ncbi:lysophosphatidylcholine acyltransferase 2-like [Lytechinus variegatus]|uniref:lysophosphatidylcholine acyltransferase 2-like n=1 Tax=Lytechinus variegatus TaxID=7654 RepID=UPI001BB225BB|nr:lysophosphatidylcholine acyltransferase 2-like [Lytechinus variegatus]
MPVGRPRLEREQSFMVAEIPNPFVHVLKMNVWDYVRIAIMSITIAPIRLLAFIILLLPAWVVCAIAVAGMTREERDQPLTGWRKALRAPILAIARCQMFCLGFHSVKVTGQRAPRDEACILVIAPHISFFDVFAFFMTGLPGAVSRQENAEIPVIGTLAKFLQPVMVSRKDPDSRSKTIAEIKRRAQPGSQWPQIAIFPEGTVTNGQCFITFKGGAFFPGVPVQPVLLRYNNKLNTFPWTFEGPSGLSVFWLSLCNLSNNLELEFLPVYNPSDREKQDAKLYARNVRAVMAKAYNVPVTDHTYEDTRLMEEAKAMGLPGEVGVVEFHKLLSKLGFKLESLRTHLTNYAEIASSGGYITIEDFAKHLNVPVSPSLQEVFDVYDRDGSGKIDFREYVIGCALISQPANTEDTIRMAFKMFGGEKEYISPEDLYQILDNAFGMEREETDRLYKEIDTRGIERVTYDEFKAYAMKKPEYATLFTRYMEMPSSSSDDEKMPAQAPTDLSPRQRPVKSKVEDVDLSPRHRPLEGKKDD